MVSSEIRYGSASGVARRFSSPRFSASAVPLLGVVVAAEDDLLVVGVAALQDRGQRDLEHRPVTQRVLELLGEIVDRLGDDRVQHRVRERQRHARAQRAELELVAGERERARAVAVAAVLGQRRQHGRSEAQERLRRRLRDLAALDRVEHLLELGAEEDRDDRRRRLVGAEPVVLALRRDRRAKQALVLVDGLDHGRAEEQELQVLARRVAGLEQVLARCRCPSTSCCACPSR